MVCTLDLHAHHSTSAKPSDTLLLNSILHFRGERRRIPTMDIRRRRYNRPREVEIFAPTMLAVRAQRRGWSQQAPTGVCSASIHRSTSKQKDLQCLLIGCCL